MRIPKPLSETLIRSLKPGARRLERGDGQGLFFVVMPARDDGRASRYWEFRYRAPETGRRRVTTLGKYPELSLSLARQRAFELRAQIAAGEDPIEVRRQERAAGTTLEQAINAWDAARADRVGEKTRSNALLRLKHVLPKLGARPVTLLRAEDFRVALDAVVARGKAETAHRIAIALFGVFDWLESRGEVTANPMRFVRRAYPAPKHTHHAGITDPRAFGELLRAIEAYRGNGVTRYALAILPYVFLRSTELRGAQWREIDLDAATWTVPASRMKIQDHGDHVVPLAPPVVAIFRTVSDLTNRGPESFVFPSLRPRRSLSSGTLSAALATMGFPPAVHTVHGFRTSASTMLNELATREAGRRFNYEHVEAQLAHRPKDAVRDAYQRSQFLDARRVMMNAWAEAIDFMRSAH